MCLDVSFIPYRIPKRDLPIVLPDDPVLWPGTPGPYVLCAKKVQVTPEGLQAFFQHTPYRIYRAGSSIALLQNDGPSEQEQIIQFACPCFVAGQVFGDLMAARVQSKLGMHADTVTLAELRRWRKLRAVTFQTLTAEPGARDPILIALAPRIRLQAIVPDTVVSLAYLLPIGDGEAFQRLITRSTLPSRLKPRLRRWIRSTAKIVLEAYELQEAARQRAEQTEEEK